MEMKEPGFKINLINDDLQRKLLDKFGIDCQTIIAMEELAELQKAFSKATRYLTDTKFVPKSDKYVRDMAEEIADVLICIRQMELYYAIPDDMIYQFIKAKQVRDIERYNLDN